MIDSLSFLVFLRLFLLFALSEGLYFLLAERHGSVPSPPFLLLWAALFLAYAFAVRAVRGRSGRFLLVFIFVTSALLRVTLLLQVAGPPTGAPEAFLQGASPARAAMEWRPDLRETIAVAFDLGSLALMPALLRSVSLPLGLALVYGWNPLLVEESAARGRIETAPLFFLFLALLLLRTKRPGAAALAYGASLAGPPFLWATVPLAARALGARLALSILVGGLAWAPLAATRSLPDLLGWPPPDHLGGSLMPATAALARLFVTRDPLVPFLLCAGAFALVALARTAKLGPEGAGLPREALVLLGCCLFLSPQALPWSYLPIAGLAAFSANPGWLVATATAPLTYLALGGWNWSFWLAFAQYFPVYATLIFVALGTKRRGKGRPGKARVERLPRA